ELKNRLDVLNQKLVGLGREYAEELDAKDADIEELKMQLADAHAKIEEHEQERDDRRERLAQVEEKVKQHHEEKKKQDIADVATRLKDLEKMHKQLAKSGKHPKKDLERVKKMIDTHKETLSSLKKK
ncbi:MAG: hypothetical protein KJ574_00105, partial [Nanoarchaeota archaeon]|nr:hypothetical protein [Nanoarchaeota archaeon]